VSGNPEITLLPHKVNDVVGLGILFTPAIAIHANLRYNTPVKMVSSSPGKQIPLSIARQFYGKIKPHRNQTRHSHHGSGVFFCSGGKEYL